MKLSLVLFFFFYSAFVFSEDDLKTVQVTGKAFEIDSTEKLLYIEKHTTFINRDNMVVSAETYYFEDESERKKIGHLKSEFSRNLNAPSYEFYDARAQDGHGVRYDGDNIIMYSFSGEGELRESKEKSSSLKSFDGRLVLAGQGFHYYLRENLNSVIEKERVPIILLIPGRLESYRFRLDLVELKENRVHLRVEMNNFFLRLFAPSIDLEYDLESGELLKYRGPSNLKDDDGKLLNVKIIYSR